jgi:hypothetical protein
VQRIAIDLKVEACSRAPGSRIFSMLLMPVRCLPRIYRVFLVVRTATPSTMLKYLHCPNFKAAASRPSHAAHRLPQNQSAPEPL